MTRAEERKMYLSIGICPICKKHSVEPNKRACMECLGKESDRYYANKAKGIKKGSDAEQKRKLTEKRRSQGLCYRCGKRPAKGLCGICKSKAAKYRAMYRNDVERSEWPNYGRCYLCGKNELMEGKKICNSCYTVRISTIPYMMAKANRSYFEKMNLLVFKKQKVNQNT